MCLLQQLRNLVSERLRSADIVLRLSRLEGFIGDQEVVGIRKVRVLVASRLIILRQLEDVA